MSVLAACKNELMSIPGWRSKRKLLVIESDDWGTIRTKSLPAYEQLKACGMDLDTQDAFRYSVNDSLAKSDDFEQLFSVLKSVTDKSGNHPVITAVANVANPDFEKIKLNDFKTYYYESFSETLKKYYPNENVFDWWQKGIQERIFIPQFHGREHLNVAVWMQALQAGDEDAHRAFEQGMWSYNNKHPNGIFYQAAFELNNIDELESQSDILADGLNLFEKLFGYRATLFVPPNGAFNNSLERGLAKHGVKFMATSKIQLESLGHGKQRRLFHYLGQKNRYGQVYLTRNCFFEPGKIGKDWVANCLVEIDRAFRWRKPAIISSHRVNYIGALNPKNRELGNERLGKLLKAITTTWPDVEFLSSDQLGEIILDSGK